MQKVNCAGYFIAYLRTYAVTKGKWNVIKVNSLSVLFAYKNKLPEWAN